MEHITHISVVREQQLRRLFFRIFTSSDRTFVATATRSRAGKAWFTRIVQDMGVDARGVPGERPVASYQKFSESNLLPSVVECIQDDLARESWRGATISTSGSMLGGKVTFD